MICPDRGKANPVCRCTTAPARRNRSGRVPDAVLQPGEVKCGGVLHDEHGVVVQTPPGGLGGECLMERPVVTRGLA